MRIEEDEYTKFRQLKKVGKDMPKINQEEYEVLKRLDDKWKWIARDEDGALWAYEDKPEKYEGDWVDLRDDCEYVGGQDFQFIQWEDSEPYNITELIEEYEYHNEPVKLAGGLSITQAKYDKYLEEHIKELENEGEETEVKKINQKEYEVLKGLDDKWKWISRDSYRDEKEYENVLGGIRVFSKKPFKRPMDDHFGVDGTGMGIDWLYLDRDMFFFIKPYDDKPYNITELIEEYEYHNEPVKLAGALSITQAKYDKYLEEHIKELENKSKETEMKKDTEWLKKEFDDLFNGKTILTVGRSVVDKILDQLDEPERIEETTHLLESVLKENKRLGKLLEEKHEEWLELMGIINNRETENLSPKWIESNSVYASSDGATEEYVHVDDLKELLVPKPEVLSQKWIDEHRESTFDLDLDEDSETVFVKVEDLQELLVPKQEITEKQAIEYLRERNMIVIEKPTIPQFIADWVEKSRNKGYNIRNIFQKTPKNVEKWLYSQDSNEKIVRLGLAYLLDEYEVEKEQRYFAKIKGHENISSDDKYWNYCITDESLDIGDNKVHADVLAEYVLNATKDEWKNLGINEDNADFVLVEELEDNQFRNKLDNQDDLK